jgi:hypothetical protein
VQVLDSIAVWILWALLPLIPAVRIFREFPDAKAFISGPLQGISVRGSGAFAAYIAVCLLGVLPCLFVQKQISASRNYHFEGLIDLGAEQAQSLDSDELFSLSETKGGGVHPGIPGLRFVVLLNTPTESRQIGLKYYSGTDASNLGPLPTPEQYKERKPVTFDMKIAGATLQAQRFRLKTDPLSVVPIAATRIVAPNGIAAAPLSAGIPGLDWFIHPTRAIRESGTKAGLATSTPIPDAPIENNSEEPSPLGLQAPVSNKCLTPAFFCYLPSYGPVGAPCWCASPYGPVAGRVGY